ncbi:MAG: type II toxin-antitoxin system VapC family toxin [Gammaproteobacteria bacterium]
MIHLDTNLLIRIAQADKRVIGACEEWLESGESFAVSSIVWFEFICGPLAADDVRLIERVVAGRILPFSEPQAEHAAALFNAAGSKRAGRWDCMIAAAALAEDARLATLNPRDFGAFADAGLRLATI